MARIRNTTILLGVAALLLSLPAAASAAGLGKSVKSLMKRTSKASGVYVYDITAGKRVTSLRGTTPRILASNTKLFTTAAALDRFGASGRFVTTVSGDGTLGIDGTFTGDLYLRGAGDPVFGSSAVVKRYYGSGASVETLAGVLEERGIKRVTGRVLGDASLFDSRRGTATYGFNQSGEIGGALSALAFNRGPWSASKNPARYAASKLRNAIRATGIDVDGSVGSALQPGGAALLASASSPTVARFASFTNKPSDNYLAEMLMKGLGVGSGPASTAGGTRAAERFAATLGSRASLADGSGLSRRNTAAPREVVDLLLGMRKRADYATYFASLAVPGSDGTLAKRMRSSSDTRRCGAKTGTLRDVSALAGYCTNRAGHVIAFAILSNNVFTPTAKSVEDKITVRIARSK